LRLQEEFVQAATRRLRLVIPTIAVAVVSLTFLAAPALAFRDRDCSDFPTQAKAQRFFKKHHPNRDPHGLDADHDGIACEDNP
jgi:hypothetical protein